MNHYLITGGAGFIGSNLIRTLLDRQADIRITCVDDFDPFYPREIKELNMRPFREDPRFSLVEADLGQTSPRELAAAVTGPVDVIVHLAGKAGVRPSIENPLSYQQANVIGLQHMLDYAREQGVRQFVFASSSSVYGVNDHFPWKEDDRLMPISPYAMTKLAGEMLGHVYHKLFGIRFLALRFFTVYGPGQRPDLAIHKFTKAILQGRPITMFGDGSTSRDYTYVEDTVSGIIAAMAYDKTPYEIVNLGNNYSISLTDLIAAIEEVTGRRARIERYPDQPGDVPKTFADIHKAQQLFGYAPQTQLADGLAKFFAWFNQHADVLMK
ncbi:MAG TPA: GDP-mannose 4,6-dehydratase [Chitinophagaceae bacterium]|nr:GDP-mannose 4,6-dehydratase [Chitinophagaceae bacterium]